jgi:hypothetical protein
MEGLPDYDYFRQFIYDLCHQSSSSSTKLHLLWKQWDEQLASHYPSQHYLRCYFCNSQIPRHCLRSLHSSVACCTQCHHQHQQDTAPNDVMMPPLEDVMMLTA